MAIFGDIGKAFQSVIKNPVVEAIFPVAAFGNQIALTAIHDIALTASHKIAQFESNAPTPQQDQHLQQLNYPFAFLPQQYPQGYGGSTWDSSTPSQDYSTPQPTLQAQEGGYSTPPRSWTSQDQWAALPPL
ncbi:MAG: hypothetical protein ACHQKY_17800 [Terriglobia bacterium]